MSDKVKISQDTFVAMQTGKPYKSYKKTILGLVYVSVLNSFSREPEGMILRGDPRKLEPDSFVDLWDDVEDAFFRRKNKRHLETGILIAFEKPENYQEPVVEKYASYSDEQLEEVLGQKWLALMKSINETNSESVLYRLLTIARENEKSEKLISAIEARLSEVQTAGYEEE